MSRMSFVLLLVVTMSFSTGCATLLRGDRQKMTFQTDPTGANVDINGKNYVAPAEVTLKRKDEYKIIVTAPGYQGIIFDLRANWDGATLGNIIMPGGSVGFGVDLLNGADRSFGTLATIKLKPLTGEPGDHVQMYHYQGRVVTKDEYDHAIREQREYHGNTGTPP